MSHIDSFSHEIVGRFGSLPVYHPLEVIDGDFQCTPSQLVLGGGSGEHPALVIANPLAAVACFLDAELRAVEGSHVNAERFPLRRRADEWRRAIDEYVDHDQDRNLHFHDWTIRHYSDFDTLCRSPALPNPYWEELELDLETWLVLGFGEFVFFAMPELAQPLIERLHDPYRDFRHIRYSNVMLIPPNMPVYANGGNAFVSHRSHR